MSERPLTVFFDLAMQYYVSGRYAAIAGFCPVSGNLLHHAVEMFLKGALSKTKNLSELKNPMSHDLPKIWAAFKVEIKDPSLDQFDATVSSLDAFEKLRYPNSVLAKGMQCTVDLGQGTPPSVGGKRAEPTYYLSLHAIDELVAKLFEVASINPAFFTSSLRPIAKHYLAEQNVVSNRLLKCQ